MILLFRPTGLQTSLFEGHISDYTTVRRPDIVRNVIVSGYVTFYTNHKFFVKLLLFHYRQTGFKGRSLKAPDVHHAQFWL